MWLKDVMLESTPWYCMQWSVWLSWWQCLSMAKVLWRRCRCSFSIDTYMYRTHTTTTTKKGAVHFLRRVTALILTLKNYLWFPKVLNIVQLLKYKNNTIHFQMFWSMAEALCQGWRYGYQIVSVIEETWHFKFDGGILDAPLKRISAGRRAGGLGK